MTRLYCFLTALLCAACAPKHDTHDSRNAKVVNETPDIDHGKSLYGTCAACHGATGQGDQKFRAPALIGHDAAYLERQLRNFKNGLRGHNPEDSSGVQMAAFARALPDTVAIRNVVAYVKTFSAAGTRLEGMKGDIKKGERIYETICGSCHGPKAIGNQWMNAPRLSGLQPWYLKDQIHKFKTSIRGAHPNDKLGAQMVQIMALLKDEGEVEDVVSYIQATAINVVK